MVDIKLRRKCYMLLAYINNVESMFAKALHLSQSGVDSILFATVTIAVWCGIYDTHQQRSFAPMQ